MKIIIFLLLFAGQITSCLPQTINYRELFGDAWLKAETFEKDNRVWMQPLLSANHISYPMAIAVVFPEFVRYSALRDKMEITLLKALYINLGDVYANFSIGQFQMKPSFAEIIREQESSVMSRKSGINFQNSSGYSDIKDFRKSIVTDLENPRTEINYLIVFLKICEKKYKTNRKGDISRLKFLATAYNYGIDKTEDQIENMTDKKFFNTKLFKTENYSYSDVALFWYNHNRESK